MVKRMGYKRNYKQKLMSQKSYTTTGFTLVEMVVAIFLIAVVLSGVLLLMAANLNVIDKANETMVANALLQYTLEEVRNIDFPPVHCDRQSSFGDRPGNGTYKTPESINPVEDGNDWTPAEFSDRFIVKKYDFRYKWDGTFLDGTTANDTDNTMYHRVDVYILKRRGNSIILQNSAIISRDGTQ